MNHKIENNRNVRSPVGGRANAFTDDRVWLREIEQANSIGDISLLMANLENKVFSAGQINQMLCIINRGRDWFFDKHIKTGF